MVGMSAKDIERITASLGLYLEYTHLFFAYGCFSVREVLSQDNINKK